MKKKPHLHLINGELSLERRLQNRIESLKEDLFKLDDLDYAEQTLEAVYNYLYQFEDAELEASCHKIRETIFFIDSWKNRD